MANPDIERSDFVYIDGQNAVKAVLPPTDTEKNELFVSEDYNSTTDEFIVSKIDPDTLSTIDQYNTTDQFNPTVLSGYGDALFVGNASNNVHQVDATDMSRVGVYTGHTDTVEALTTVNQRVFSGARDNEVHQIDPEDMSRVDKYTQHTGDVYSLTRFNGRLFSGSYDDTVHEIDPSDMSQINTYAAGGNIADTEEINGTLFAAATNNTVHKIDPSNMTQLDTYTNFGSSVDTVEALTTIDGFLIVGDGEGGVHKINPSGMTREEFTTTSAGVLNHQIVSLESYSPLGAIYVGDGSAVRKLNVSDLSTDTTKSGSSGVYYLGWI